MNIVKWRPMLDLFDEDIERMFGNLPGFPGSKGFVPMMDVYQTKDAVVVETPIAGMDPKKISISVENDVLTVEGRMEKHSEVDEKDYYLKEVREGSFHRSLALPASVDGNQANAEAENGMLRITIPKSERTKPKTISVNIK